MSDIEEPQYTPMQFQIGRELWAQMMRPQPEDQYEAVFSDGPLADQKIRIPYNYIPSGIYKTHMPAPLPWWKSPIDSDSLLLVPESQIVTYRLFRMTLESIYVTVTWTAEFSLQ